jgi:hypothetical protein
MEKNGASRICQTWMRRTTSAMTNTIAQASVGLDRIRAILNTEVVIPEKPNAKDPGTVRGKIVLEHVQRS